MSSIKSCMRFKGKEISGMIWKIIYNLIIILILLGMVGCNNIIILPEHQEEEIDLEEEIEAQEDVIRPTLPIEGAQLKIPLTKQVETNPLFSISKDYINFAGLIYEGLFSYDENLNLVATLVEEWKVLEDGKKWEFKLKKGIKWHNGHELVGEDVKYTFDLLFNYNKRLEEEGEEEGKEEEKKSFYAEKLFKDLDIVGMELLENDPYTIVLILKEPAGRILKDAFTFPILPKDIVNIDDINSLVGTGPFKVESGNMEIGGQIKLFRNTNWWDDAKPHIDSIVVKIYQDNVESMEAFKKGQVDLVDTHVDFVEPPELVKKIQIYRYLTQNYTYIGINHKTSSLLSDKRVREAIAYAIDRKDIISRVYSHNAQAVDVPIPLDSWLYDPDLRLFDYQEGRARQILKEVGLRTPLSFTINVNMDNDTHKEALNLIVEQLADIGIEVNVRLLAWDEYVEALEQGDFEAVLGEYYLDVSSDLRFMLHSREISNGLNNYFGYNNLQLNGLLDVGNEEDEPEKTQETYKRIQKHLIEELPIISLYYRTSSLVTNEKVHGIKATRELMIYRDIEEWYLSK